jgi:hypothetical protein
VGEEEITKFVRVMDKEVPLKELGANLRNVAEKRGIVGASLDLHFSPSGGPDYYNVYRYAFFGMVPDNLLDPVAKSIDPVPIEKKQLFTAKR